MKLIINLNNICISYIVYKIKYHTKNKKEKEKELKDSIAPNISLKSEKRVILFHFIIYLTKVYIIKLSFIISLLDKISRNPSLIIYVDLKITTVVKRNICPANWLMCKFVKYFNKKRNLL